jgi:hypothetical protein
METILFASGGWLITAFLLANAGTKLNKKFTSTFLVSLLLSPIGGLIYLNLKEAEASKKSKRGGPWSEWISKAVEAQ